MKTIEQVIGFIQGWEHAISCGDESLDKENAVLVTLREILSYINKPLIN